MTQADSLHVDALFTADSGQGLLLPVADCVAAVLYDPIHHVVGIAHLGRHSLEQNGGQKVIEFMQSQFDSLPETIQVQLGPAPSKESYKIWALDNKGMKEATFQQLFAAGVLASNIMNNTAETDKDSRYYSYSQFLKGNRPEDGDYAVLAVMTD